MRGEIIEHGPMMPEEYYPDEPPIGPNWEYGTDRIYPTDDPEVPPRYATWTEREWPNRDNSQSRSVQPPCKDKEQPATWPRGG